jgi:hypothetical protein
VLRFPTFLKVKEIIQQEKEKAANAVHIKTKSHFMTRKETIMALELLL